MSGNRWTTWNFKDHLVLAEQTLKPSLSFSKWVVVNYLLDYLLDFLDSLRIWAILCYLLSSTGSLLISFSYNCFTFPSSFFYFFVKTQTGFTKKHTKLAFKPNLKKKEKKKVGQPERKPVDSPTPQKKLYLALIFLFTFLFFSFYSWYLNIAKNKRDTMGFAKKKKER